MRKASKGPPCVDQRKPRSAPGGLQWLLVIPFDIYHHTSCRIVNPRPSACEDSVVSSHRRCTWTAPLYVPPPPCVVLWHTFLPYHSQPSTQRSPSLRLYFDQFPEPSSALPSLPCIGTTHDLAEPSACPCRLLMLPSRP
jgi:hypothetical protein